ncbi:Actin, cytoplasmic 1 [Orchesella cincta]|uniref:Actin, cytoplasmic 1 n=1 Tax=Orchesella cincta TaxID=48709 RepID=A0A1D2MMC7_ORCCI|nr:Actin, cytoplasmic 1 [Orchesella cincta]
MVNEVVRPAVVIDNGSGSIKAGLAGEDAPKTILQNVVGHRGITRSNDKANSSFIGNDLISNDASLKLKYPMENGVVVNWDDMESVWAHVLQNELKVKPEEFAMLLTEAPLNAHENRRKLGEIFFEKFNTPAMYVCIPAVLALYSTGRKTGLVLDSGDEVTCAVPVIDGYAVPDGIRRLNMGGRKVTNLLNTLLYKECSYAFDSNRDLEILRKIKEGLEGTVKCEDGFKYELPDGQVITIGDKNKTVEQLFEPLFNPSLANVRGEGMAELMFQSANATDQALFSNVVISGGNTMLPGFEERFRSELGNLMGKDSNKLKIIPAGTSSGAQVEESRQCAAWRGGSILANLSAFQNMWVGKKEYEELGAEAIIHAKKQ